MRDPGETRDLSEVPEHRPRFQSMLALLNELRDRDTALGEQLRALGEGATPGADAVDTSMLEAIGYTR